MIFFRAAAMGDVTESAHLKARLNEKKASKSTIPQ